MPFDFKKEYRELYRPGNKPETVETMDKYLAENGYASDLGRERLHHEIYLTDPCRVPPEKRRTIIRHPIKKVI